MNITIVGAGAIGTLFGIKLAKSGHRVHFLTRHQENRIERCLNGLDLVEFVSNSADEVAHADLVIVTTKAFQVCGALKPWLEHFPVKADILLLHNGMGTAHKIESYTKAHRLFLGTTTHGAMRLTSSEFRHVGQGETRIGAFHPDIKEPEWLSSVHKAIPSTQWHSDIHQALWLKLAVNCMINPLSAIHQCKNGQLLDDGFQDTWQQMSKEISAVMVAEGVETTPQEVLFITRKVALATAENYSSMNRDIHYHRQSENAFITGYLLDRADYHGLDVPQNRALWQQITELEQGYENT
ncbi:2-dehydropantoate 2-reductase [Parasalinivibrio latis]|uniref:2-dehydropantoate 2-reductase n=1 Tax=Parasalinivibrio latis TaxID=2952610 RepID=UPI0030DECF12